MNSKTMKLTGRFNTMKLDKGEKQVKGKEIKPGPLKMLESLEFQVKEYMQNAPLIRVFSNPGMQERHWKEVSKYTGFEITPGLPLTIRKLTDDKEIFTHVTKLEEISEVAEK